MIIGVWAYLDNNIGDDLMIKLVVNRFSEHSFRIYSDLSVVRETFSGLENVDIMPKSRLKSDIAELDFFFSIGGSIFNNLNHPIGQFNRVRRILLLKKIKSKGIKIATIGCNLGPYRNNFGKWLTKQELKLNDLVTLRDEKSFEMVKDFGCIQNFHFYDDIVFNLPTLVSSTENKTQSSLGITVYRNLSPEENNMEVYKTLARICDEFISRNPSTVRLFAFDSENENDLAAAHHIFALSKEKQYIKIVPYLGDHGHVIEELSLCDKLIAIRFHGCVLSIVLKIPFTPIIYSNKTENFLDDMGYTGRKIWLDELNADDLNVADFVDDLISGRNLFLPEKTSNAEGHFTQIQQLLKEVL